MKHFCLFLLALVASGGMALSHVTSGVTAPAGLEIARGETMTSVESNHSNAVEVGGLRFETLVPVPVVTVPPNQPDTTTPVRFGIRVTNMEPIP